MRKEIVAKARVTTFLLDDTRIFPVVLDMDNIVSIDTDIGFKQYDYGTSFIDAQLISQKTPLSVTGKRIVGIFRDSRGNIFTDKEDNPISSRASILMEDNGVVRVPVPRDIISTTGKIECEIIVFNSKLNRLTSPRFSFNIEDSITDYVIEPVPLSGESVCGQATCGGKEAIVSRTVSKPVESFLSEKFKRRMRGD